MRTRKKILLWISAVPALLVVLALVLPILLPRIIDLESVKNKIQAALSQELGGRVTLERLDISVLPRPGVKVRRLRISLPGSVEGTADSLSVHPRILPLFTGKLRVARIAVNAPDFTIRVSHQPERKKKEKAPHTLEAIKESITAAGARLASTTPSLAVVIHRGRVAVLYAKDPPITIEQLEARVVLPPRGFSVRLGCSTSFWKNLSINAKLDPQTLTAAGSLEVEALKPHLLGPFLVPDVASPLGDSLVDLDLSFKTDGVRNFQATVTGSAPHLRFLRARQTLLIQDAQFNGSVELDERKIAITLNQLKADSPRLALKGALHRDVTVPRASLTVTGKNIDIQALREAALFFAPKDRTVRGIFEVLRAGAVPAITFASTGTTPADLGDLMRMRITAALQKGALDIPGTPLHLTNAAGNAVLSEGVLQGDQLTARLGNTAAQNGTLRLGLQGGNAPFHLDIMVKADLAELPPILKSVISDQAFTHELGLLRNVKGFAQGRLVLGESTQSIKATADISSFGLKAAYERVPFPVELRGGRFFYDGKNMIVERIQGNLGKSSLTDLTARLPLTASSNLEITSAQSTLFLGELHPWLSSFPAMKQALQGIETVQGTARLSIQDASFPLAAPGTLRFTAAGSVKNLSIGSKGLPGPLRIDQAGFRADTNKIFFTNAKTELLDASLNVDCRLDGYLKTILGGELTVTGTLGKEALQRLGKEFSLPSEFTLRPPVSLSQIRVAWQGKDTFSGTGALTLAKGPGVTFDVSRDPRTLAIKTLRIQDDAGRADITLKLEKKTLDLAVSGALQEKTLKKIFANEHVQRGRFTAAFEAHIPFDRLRQSTARGTFEGEHLLLPLGLKATTTIDRVSLTADRDRISVGSLTIRLGDARLDFTGTLAGSAQGYQLDGDLSADTLAGDALVAALAKERGEDAETQAQKKPPRSSWDMPLQGTVRFNAGSITYGRMSASPVHADITLGSNSIRAAVTETMLCGISVPGTVTATPVDIALDFSFAAERQNLESSLSCLRKESRITGAFSLKGRVSGRGTGKTLLPSLQGTVQFTAENGLIYNDSVMVKILSFLSVNELVRGKLPDAGKQGVPYRTAVLQGTLQQGVFHIGEYSVNGPVVDIAGQGDIDVVRNTLDLTVVVAPLTLTSDIIKNIPGVNYIMQGTLVTIPLHVHGPFDDVKVTYNPVSAVGKGIFGILKRAVELPLKPFESNKPAEEKP